MISYTDFPRVTDPYDSPSAKARRTTRMHYTMLWSHAYGRSIRGMGTSVCLVMREPYSPVRAWEYPYDQWCRSLQGLVRSASPRWQIQLCDIWPVRANKTTNWPSMGTKSLVARVWKLHMPNLQPREIWHPHNLKFFETSCWLAMHAVWFPTGQAGP